MLRSLMKYEFMAMGRVFLPLYGALIVISIVNRIIGSFEAEIPSGISIFILVVLMIGIAVITCILMIQRFWTNLLSGEGYLMMTLPVSTARIILSKLFTASVLCVASSIVVAISIFIAFFVNLDFSDIVNAIKYVRGLIPFSSGQVVILLIQFLIACILWLFTNIMLLYASMSLSMISNKHRWLVAVGAFIVLTTALQVIVSVASVIGVSTGVFEQYYRLLLSFPSFGQVQLILLACMILSVGFLAAYYFITRYMLKNRLNLQ